MYPTCCAKTLKGARPERLLPTSPRLTFEGLELLRTQDSLGKLGCILMILWLAFSRLINTHDDIQRVCRRPTRGPDQSCLVLSEECNTLEPNLVPYPMPGPTSIGSVRWRCMHQATVSASLPCETRLLDCRLVPIPNYLPAHWRISLLTNTQLVIREQNSDTFRCRSSEATPSRAAAMTDPRFHWNPH